MRTEQGTAQTGAATGVEHDRRRWLHRRCLPDALDQRRRDEAMRTISKLLEPDVELSGGLIEELANIVVRRSVRSVLTRSGCGHVLRGGTRGIAFQPLRINGGRVADASELIQQHRECFVRAGVVRLASDRCAEMSHRALDVGVVALADREVVPALRE